MSKKKKSLSFVKQIQVDKNTNEPVIVDIPEEEYLNQPIVKADFVEDNTNKKIRKKNAKEKFLGIKEDDSISKRQKFFKRITSIVFIVFVVAVLFYTAYRDFCSDKAYPSIETLKSIFSSGWLYLFIAFSCLFVSFFFKGLKNVVMCKSMTGKSHFKTCMETGIIGSYYNTVTPLAVGGQPFEIYHLSKHGVHGGVASSIPIASFFLNQLSFVILGIISIVLFKQNVIGAPQALIDAFPAFYVLSIIGLVCCLFVPSLVIIFSMMPKLGAKIVYLIIKIGTKLKIVKNPEETLNKTVDTVVHNSHCLKSIASKPLVFFLIFLLSFLENIANVSIAFFVLKAFGLSLQIGFVKEWILVCIICFILFASITFIPTPGNSGAADLSFYLLFETVLFPGLVFPAMLVWRLFSFYNIIIIGFIFATFKKKSDLKRAKLQAHQNETKQLSFLDDKTNDNQKE